MANFAPISLSNEYLFVLRRIAMGDDLEEGVRPIIESLEQEGLIQFIRDRGMGKVQLSTKGRQQLNLQNHCKGDTAWAIVSGFFDALSFADFARVLHGPNLTQYLDAQIRAQGVQTFSARSIRGRL